MPARGHSEGRRNPHSEPRGLGWATRGLGALACILVGGCSEPTGLGQGGEVLRLGQAIESGELDDEHRSVFRVITRADGYNALCSATLIAPNLLLTARHCVAEIDDDGVDCATDRFAATTEPNELLFANDTTPTLLSRWFAASAVLVNESTTTFCGNDVGLVILEDNVPEQVAIPSEVRLVPLVVQDEPYSAVGYGGDMGDEREAQYGARRSRADLVVECVGRICGESVTEAEFGGSGGGCPGDSGGPAFDREGRVLGALSRGHDECTSPVYSAASQFRDLLFDAAIRAAAQGEYPLPVWAGGEPVAVTPEQPDAGAAQQIETDDAPTKPPKPRLERQTGCSLTTPGSHARAVNSAWAWNALLALLLLRRRAASTPLSKPRARQFSATSSIGMR